MPKPARCAPASCMIELVHASDPADIRGGPCPSGSTRRTRPPRRFSAKMSLCTQATPRTSAAGRARPGAPEERGLRADFSRKRACTCKRPRGHSRRAVPVREHPKNAASAPIFRENELVHASNPVDIRGGPCPSGSTRRTRSPRRFSAKTSLRMQATPRTSAAGCARPFSRARGR